VNKNKNNTVIITD